MSDKKLQGAFLGVMMMLVGPGAAQAQVCHDFQDDSLGQKTGPFSTVSGSGFPPPGYFTFTNQAENWVEIDEHPSPQLHALRFPGTPGDLIVEPLYFGTLPEFVAIAVSPWAGDVTVRAYDDSDVEIFSDVVQSNNPDWVIIENVGQIAYLRLEGGSEENWITAICIDEG